MAPRRQEYSALIFSVMFLLCSRMDAMSDAATKADAESSSACEADETSDDDYSEDGSISMVSEELELGDEIKDIPLQALGCDLSFTSECCQ